MLFVDYGNVSMVKELRELAPEIERIPPLVEHLKLQTFEDGTLSEMDFRDLCISLNGKSVPFKVVDDTSVPKLVRMYLDGNQEVQIRKE